MQLNIEQKLKERLVGMGVLVFLGIIVIPWILDGERPDELNADSGQAQTLNLPSPDGLKTRDINLQDGSIKVVNMKTPERISEAASNSEASTSIPNDNSSLVINENVTKSAAASNKSGGIKNADSSKAETQPDNKKIETASPLKLSKAITVQSKPKVVDSKQVKPASTVTMQEKVKTDPVATWTVQMGSFGDKANADRLMKQLNDKGFPAFVNRYQNDVGKVLFRVRVGTEKDRARADKLQARLANSDFKGKVLTHP